MPAASPTQVAKPGSSRYAFCSSAGQASSLAATLRPTAPCWAAISGAPCGGIDLVAGGQRHDLRLAGALDEIEADEAFADARRRQPACRGCAGSSRSWCRDPRPAARARRGRRRRLHNRGRRGRRGSASPSGSAAAAPSGMRADRLAARVCRCITAWASSRAMWIAEWMVKPAGLVMNGVGSTGLPWCRP